MSIPAGRAWAPTMAHIRAAALGVGGSLLALTTHSVDLLALAAPLLLMALWGNRDRPRGSPSVRFRPAHLLTEEDAPTVSAILSGDLPAGSALIALGPPRTSHAAYGGSGTAYGLVVAADDLRAETEVMWRPTRWGVHDLHPTYATAHWTWLAFAAHVTVQDAPSLTVTPVPLTLPRLADLPTRRGLPGSNPSSVIGPGTDMAEIRPFHPGDDVRRVHWPASSRLGQLHIVETTRDIEVTVEFVLDTTALAPPQVDTAVRLTAGLAGQLLGRGERVSLTILGSKGLPHLRPGRGRSQDARIRGLLALVDPSPDSVHDEIHYLHELRRPNRPGDIAIGIGAAHDPLMSLLLRRSRLGARAAILSMTSGAAAGDVDIFSPIPVVTFDGPGSVLLLPVALTQTATVHTTGGRP